MCECEWRGDTTISKGEAARWSFAGAGRSGGEWRFIKAKGQLYTASGGSGGGEGETADLSHVEL